MTQEAIHPETLRRTIAELNEDLSALLRREPAPLVFQAGRKQEDPLFLYGIVGGKDVGKTTLINRLAGSRISLDTDLIDEGTRIATAYCHRADEDVFRTRMVDRADRVKLSLHNRDPLKNVVLIDFPDFDSRFTAHLADVKTLIAHLESIVWVTSPRKYGDAELFDQLAAVAQSNENYMVVLNKVDQIAEKASLDEIRREVTAHLAQECRKKGAPPLTEAQFFAVSAISPERFEFDRLRERIVRPLNAKEVALAKARNLRAEFDRNLARMEDHFAVARRIERLDAAAAFVRSEVEKRFDETRFEAATRRFNAWEGLHRRMSKGLFIRKIAKWPILRTLFFPLAHAVAAFGGRAAFSEAPGEERRTPRDLLRHEGAPASTAMREIREAAQAEFPELAEDFGDFPDYGEALDQRLDTLVADTEESITERLEQAAKPPGILRRFFLYFPLVWFPLLQPLAARLIAVDGPLFTAERLTALTAALVSLLGVGSLLASLVFLILFYGIWMGVIYSGCAKDVRKAGSEAFSRLWHTGLLPFIFDALVQDLATSRTALAARAEQIAAVKNALDAGLDDGR